MTAPPAPGVRRNRWVFGVGTLGRDMVYTLVAFFLVFYLTEVIDVDDRTLGWITALLLVIRVADALLDPVVGALVDSTRTRWGQFKPWMIAGTLASAVLTIALFTDTGRRGGELVAVVAVLNLLWGLAWAAHDISYWGMLPALSTSPRDRESIASVAKIFASLGQFGVVVAAPLVAASLAKGWGSETRAWQAVAVGCTLLMLLTMAVTITGVRERSDVDLDGERTGLRELARAVFGNDQLLWVAAAYLLFMVGYGLTASFGLYFFKYVYGDESVFSVFAAFVGVGQLLGLTLFPVLTRRWPRRRLFRAVTAAIVATYLVFMLAPLNLWVLGGCAVVLFFLASVISLLMIVFQADTIEYGQWRLGRRNGAVTFALQPLVNKVSAAVNTAVVGVVAILSGINEAQGPADVSPGGVLLLKAAMLILPALLIGAGYLVWRRTYRIDEALHARIVRELAERGDLAADRG